MSANKESEQPTMIVNAHPHASVPFPYHYSHSEGQMASDMRTPIKPCAQITQHMQDCEFLFEGIGAPKGTPRFNKDKMTDVQRYIAYNTFATPCARYLGLYLHYCLHNGAKIDEIAVEKQTAQFR